MSLFVFFCAVKKIISYFVQTHKIRSYFALCAQNKILFFWLHKKHKHNATISCVLSGLVPNVLRRALCSICALFVIFLCSQENIILFSRNKILFLGLHKRYTKIYLRFICVLCELLAAHIYEYSLCFLYDCKCFICDLLVFHLCSYLRFHMCFLTFDDVMCIRSCPTETLPTSVLDSANACCIP